MSEKTPTVEEFLGMKAANEAMEQDVRPAKRFNIEVTDSDWDTYGIEDVVDTQVTETGMLLVYRATDEHLQNRMMWTLEEMWAPGAWIRVEFTHEVEDTL